MKCEVCGMDIGLSHICSGIGPPRTPEEEESPPDGIAPGHYLRLAFRIALWFWDDVAVRRAARDPDSLFYGGIFSALTAAFVFLVTALPGILHREGATPGTIFWSLLLGLVFVWVTLGVIALVQVGVCHLLAKTLFGVTGRFVGVLRPALLAWPVNGLAAIPYGGVVIAAIAWTAVLTLILSEADSIGRLQAFFISAGVNAIFLALLFLLPH